MRLGCFCFGVLVACVACGGGGGGPERSNVARDPVPPASPNAPLPPLWAPLFVDRKAWTMPLVDYHPDRPTQRGTITCTIDGVGPYEGDGYESSLVCQTDRGLVHVSVGRTFQATRAGLWIHGVTDERKLWPKEEVVLTDPPKAHGFERKIHDGRERFDIRARGQDWCITNLHHDDLTGVRERVLCLRPGVGVVGGRESTPAGDPRYSKIGASWGTEIENDR